MNTMGPMLRGAVYLLFAIVPLAGCGDDTAADGTTVVAPGDTTVSYSSSGGGVNRQTSAPLEFQVSDAKGNPVPGVKVRFFAGGRVFALSDRANVALNSDATFFETTTDDRGMSPTDIYPRWSVPVCDLTADVTVTGTVRASVGVASANWTVNITVKKPTGTAPTTC